MPHFETITFKIENRIATITLNRPDAANSMNLALVRDIARAALICDTSPDVKVVLITGTGKMFSAGGDLKSFAGFGDQSAVKIKEIADEIHKAISLFARMSPLVVVAVNGTAAGAGFSLALIGDYVLAAESAKFTMAYTRAGLTPDGSSTYYLPRMVGTRRAQELILTNRMLSAAEALEWGVVTKVVADDALQSEAMKIAAMFAEGPGQSHATVKRLLLATLGNTLETQMEMEGREIAVATRTADGIAGIKAFVAKEKPKFA